MTEQASAADVPRVHLLREISDFAPESLRVQRPGSRGTMVGEGSLSGWALIFPFHLSDRTSSGLPLPPLDTGKPRRLFSVSDSSDPV